MDRPVFVVGMPRSGTTIVHHAMALHERVGWISNYSDVFPASTLMFVVPRLYGLPGFRVMRIGEKHQHQQVSRLNKILPTPAEAYGLWSRWCGDKVVFEYLLCEKAPAKVVRTVRSKIARAQRLQGKDRFIAKFTGPLRITYLSSIFPDATFIHVLRDPRAVIGSLLHTSFWRDGGGHEHPWWRGGLPLGVGPGMGRARSLCVCAGGAPVPRGSYDRSGGGRRD